MLHYISSFLSSSITLTTGPPILIPPKLCIQRVPVPWPVRVPVHIRVPYKVVEKVEVKVPVPVKVREPFPVRIPFPVPYPVQQQPPPKEDKPLPPPPPPPPPPVIHPPPTIIHNYVPEPEHHVLMRPRPYLPKPRRKKEYREMKVRQKYEHYDDPNPEIGYEEMEEMDEHIIPAVRQQRPPPPPFAYGQTGLIQMQSPYGPQGMFDPRCLTPQGMMGSAGIMGAAGFGAQMPLPMMRPMMPPTSTNVFVPNPIQMPQQHNFQFPHLPQANGKDCIKVCQ